MPRVPPEIRHAALWSGGWMIGRGVTLSLSR
jgi:hypothetical protein